MSNPAVIFGCSLLAFMVGLSSFHIGPLEPVEYLQTLRVLRRGSAFSSHLPRTPLPRTGVKIVLGAAHFHGFGVARAGPWSTWVNRPQAVPCQTIHRAFIA